MFGLFAHFTEWFLVTRFSEAVQCGVMRTFKGMVVTSSKGHESIDTQPRSCHRLNGSRSNLLSGVYLKRSEASRGHRSNCLLAHAQRDGVSVSLQSVHGLFSVQKFFELTRPVSEVPQ